MLQPIDNRGRAYYSSAAGASLNHCLDPDLLETMKDKAKHPIKPQDIWKTSIVGSKIFIFLKLNDS